MLLCLACSSTILDRNNAGFITECCNRPLCDSCLRVHPRLKLYKPCLACLGGVDAVATSDLLKAQNGYSSPYQQQLQHDQDAFVIGDDDEEEQSLAPEQDNNTEQPETLVPAPTESQDMVGPPKYWLKKGDTLNGIALRYKINPREICHLNGLPTSTLSTTPYLLHTRRFITLPLTERRPSPPPPELALLEEQRKSERAAKQFQFVTKEVDWHVAKTYVALAGPSKGGVLDDSHSELKSKATKPHAISQYLEDIEWEQEQLKAGIRPQIQPFPYFLPKN